MPKFNNRDEYNKWKAAQAKQEAAPPAAPVRARIDGTARPGPSLLKIILLSLYVSVCFALIFVLLSPEFDVNLKEMTVKRRAAQKQKLPPPQAAAQKAANASARSRAEAPVMITIINESASKSNLIETVNKAKKAVVMIRSSKFTGSGFFFTPDGHVITSAHVLGSDTAVTVTLGHGAEVKAEVIKKADAPLDIAILKTQIKNADYLVLGNSDECVESMDVLAIGSPMELANTITKGIISSCGRVINGVRYLQTDAAVNPGSSGGPLINEKGEVLGVVTATAEKQSGQSAPGVNFAVSVNVVKAFKENRQNALYVNSPDTAVPKP